MAAELTRFPLILLAGGKSSRLGQPKGLIEVRGKPWVLTQCERSREMGGRKIILVLGYDAKAYQRLEPELARLGVETVLNPDPANGPFTSIQTGFRRALELGAEGAFVQPVDVPIADEQAWKQLGEALKPGVRICQPLFHDHGRDRGGHPALVSAEEMRHVVTMKPTDRLDARIHALKEGELSRVCVRDFSVIVNLNSPEDWAHFKTDSATIEEIGKAAAILSVVEVGLGSLLHAFHVPTSGHWLSLNQAFWLSRTTVRLRQQPDARWAPMTLSNVVASLKSLSPAGKKLTPMLAISAQGLLFNLGTLLFGRNVFGASVGAILLSFWAFIQPVAIYWIIFGNTLIQAAEKLFQKGQETFHFSDAQAVTALSLIVGVKALLAVGVVVLARKMPERNVDRYREKLEQAALRSYRQKKPRSSNPAMQALRDLFQPLFFVSLALTMVFFFWAESSKSQFIWGLIRPVAVGFVVFFVIRILPQEKILARLESWGFHRFAAAFRVARSALASRKNP